MKHKTFEDGRQIEIPETERDAWLCADALVNTLKQELGGDWKPRVWENLGWHYSARLGSIEVTCHYSNGSVSASVDDVIDQPGGTPMSWYDTDETPCYDPVETVKKQMKVAWNKTHKDLAVLRDNMEKMNHFNVEEL